jgi:hypothetical protein
MPTLAQGYMKLQVDLSATGTPDWTNVPGVTVANGLGYSENRIDVTDFDTAPGSTESISGPRANTPLTFTMHDEPTDEAQIAILEASDDNESLGWRLKRGTKAQIFKGVPVVTLAAPVNGVVTYSVSITPDAKPTRGNVTP